MLSNFCVCVFWPPASISFLGYESVGFQPQAVDITDLGSVHPPSVFLIPPTLKMHTSDENKRTKDIQWEHLLATSVGSGASTIT